MDAPGIFVGVIFVNLNGYLPNIFVLSLELDKGSRWYLIFLSKETVILRVGTDI